MGTTGLSITLANSIIGVGILAMPFCFQQCGLLLGGLTLLLMGFMSRLCCYFLLKSALLARRRNFEFLAFHVFGSAGKMAVELGIIGFLMGTCIAYFVVVGDLGPQIVAKMFNINQSDILRTSIMVIVSLVCVLPLGLLRNVDSLSNVSAATICFYICLVMKVITEAASQLMTSDWHRRVEMWRPAGLLQCVPIISMALFCQTQLFEIFESLPTLSLEKMNLVTKNAINICTVVYFTLGVFGYIAFCSQGISGNILMSLSPTMASDVIKLGFVMSVAFSFPLIIFPCRASLYSFLYKKVHSSHHDHIINHSIPETTFRCITVAIIAVALFVSVLIPNIELVLGLVGSTIGVLICVVFPAACFVNVTYKNTNERVLAKGILFLGLIIMVLGTYANLEAAGENSKVDRYDDKYTQEKIDKIVEDFFEKRDKDGVYLKPEPIEIHNNIPLNNEKIKDSEVQPPNPVPPESQSNEKIAAQKLEVLKYEEKKVEPIPVMKEMLKKVSQTHPKNLRTKLDEKINGVDKPELQKPTETKLQSNEEKNDMLKQQKLIETIKQHGEEQKELMKEQKEILDEIIKTKKELEHNKNEADTKEAKKIAMESIKQIANMAIQSLGGASEKPVQIDEKKEDRLEKLTNEAVQEIAKKAVETIEAIKEIKENPEPSKLAKDASIQNIVPAQANNAGDLVQSHQNVQPPVNSPNMNPQINLQNGQPQINSQDYPKNIKPRAINLTSNQQQGGAPLNIQPEAVNPQNVQPQVNIQHQAVNSQIPQNLNNPQNLANIVNPPVYIPQNKPANIQEDKVPINAQVRHIQNKAPINLQTNKESKAVDNEVIQLSKVQIPAQIQGKDEIHSHSPDEPQSYKLGEDAQVKNPEAKVPKNVPLPIAMNDLLSSKQIQEKEAVGRQLNDDIQVNVPQKVETNSNIQPHVVRQKREVVDYTQKVQLEPKELEKPTKTKPHSNEEKNYMLKQQKLIKTIQQYGEEQKELTKEQKDILDEIIKSKKELGHNTNEADTKEAKKIAMESIKQIANMAIQSLGGASEKPVQIDEKKEDRLEKLTNEAVQEIAKKAVEIIEVIKEIKENPALSKLAKDASIQNNVPAQANNAGDLVQSHQNVQPPVNTPNMNPQINLQTGQPQINSQAYPKNIKLRTIILTSDQQQGGAPLNVQPEAINPQNVQPQVNIQHQAVNSQILQNLNNPQNLANIINLPVYIPENKPTNKQEDIVPVKAQVRQIQNKAPINLQTNKESKAVENEVIQLSKVQIPAQIQGKDEIHSHSPDEPQSYKLGEDAQVKNPEAKVPKNVPLPIAMNDLLSSKQIQEKEAVGRQLNDIQPNVVRLKREVVDCTQKVQLEPKDREICNTLVDRPKEKDIMPPVDLRDMLPKSLVMDTNMLNIGRSLKSYERDER